jgi:hypothetical protein
MSRQFVKFPPLFFHLDKDFSLFEKSKSIQFASQRIRDYSTGLKFYALLYQEPAFTCAQIGLFQRMMVCNKSGLALDKSSVPFEMFTREDLEQNFPDSKNALIEQKISENAFKTFLKSNLSQQFDVYINPKIVDYGKHSELVSESSINFFYIQAQIERFSEITVLYDDENMDEHEVKLVGQPALSFQKAYDYLNGKTILDLSRNLSRVELSPFAREHLPKFAAKFDELFSEVAMYKDDKELIEELKQQNKDNGPYPEAIDEDFDEQFDSLLEEAVNEYEAKFDAGHE